MAIVILSNEQVRQSPLRPHSAKQARNYWAQTSHEETLPDEQGRPFLRPNKKLMSAGSASNDFSRLLPKRILHDKERLYYETLQLKTSLNEVAEENLRLKTKVAILEKEKERLHRTDEVALRRGGRSGALTAVVEVTLSLLRRKTQR
jgi:hypothetical protein